MVLFAHRVVTRIPNNRELISRPFQRFASPTAFSLADTYGSAVAIACSGDGNQKPGGSN
jgi:hypothetical protein